MAIYNTIIYISIFQFSLFACFLLMSAYRKILSNRILAVFLTCKVLCYIQTAFWRNKAFAIVHIPHLFYIGPGFELLLGPALFYYMKGLMNENLKFTGKDFIHTIPFFIYFLIMFILFHRFDMETKTQMLTDKFLGREGYLVHNLALYGHFILYCAACIIKTIQYQKQAENHYASIHKKKVQWIQFLIAGLMVIWILGVIKVLFRYYGAVAPIPASFNIIFIFIFANAMFFTGFSSRVIFLPIPEDITPRKKYQKSSIDEVDLDRMLHRIVSFMEEKKPFLDPNFSLQMLSSQTGLAPHKISQVINTGLGKNFYDLVNGFRIDESKKLLKKNALSERSKKTGKKTVLEILYEAGFNSKSAFHRAFKKHTGMTPTIFTRSIMKK